MKNIGTVYLYKNNEIKRFGGIIMCVISFDFPEEILLSLHKNKDDIANYAKQMCAVDLYSKGGKLRRIYIPQALQNEALIWLDSKKQDSGFIFLNKYGERITTRGISGQLKKLASKYGIDTAVIYPHSFRHRFAKSFLDRCNDIAFLADLMGHESIETTRIYLRRTASEQQALVDKIVTW